MKPIRNIKMIILDLDGTLYPYHCIVKVNYENAINFLTTKLNTNRNNIIEMFKRNDIYPYVTNKNKSITAYISEIGISLEEWNQYRNNHFNVENILESESVSLKSLEILSGQYYLILLSSNTKQIIFKILDKLKICKDLFTKIISSEDFIEKNKILNKTNSYKNLSQIYNIQFEEMLSIGDRYSTDVEPLINLGGLGVVISHPKDIDSICNDLKTMVIPDKTESYQWYLG